MRHRYNRLKELSPWAQKTDLRLRNLVTSLVENWQIKTTSKKASILKREADKFFSNLVSASTRYENEKDWRALNISLIKWYINSDSAWKKLVNELLPKYIQAWKKFGFVQTFKLWYRKWDWAEEVVVKLV